MNKLLFMILVALTVLCFACDEDKDKDKPQATETCKCDDGSNCPDGDKAKCAVKPAPKCDPSCDADKQDCVCEGDTCTCKDKVVSCKCDDGTDCPEGNKDKCAVDSCKDRNEGDECGENKTCQKDDTDKLVCKDKVVTCTCDDGTACPEGGKEACTAPVTTCEGDSACNPPCEGTDECVCVQNSWTCMTPDPCRDKNEGDECGENKTCQKDENDELKKVCKDKPVDAE